MALPKNWVIKNKEEKDIVSILLENRGITDTEAFFNPVEPKTISLQEVNISPSEVEKAVARIRSAIERNEQVVIFGDYDVDGVCSTTLLWETLYSQTKNVFPFIPDRFSDGYGLNTKSLEKVIEKYPEVKLLITVDNGIVAHEAIEMAQERNIDTIVCDHHEKQGENKAYAVVHSTEVCGTAVTWFLCRELGNSERLDLVSLATVADQMKLLGINRSFVFHGINALRKTKRVGLLALAEVSGVEISNCGTYEIGFVIGPRMNAAGRLSHALDVVRLLCTKDRKKAMEIAFQLNELNEQRQNILQDTLKEARAQVSEIHKFIIIVGEFHEGVIGLAAGRIVEETGKPTLVLSKGENGVKGSGRSVSGFHLTEALTRFSHLLSSVGGHEMAAGLSVSNENLEEFVEAFQKYANEKLTDDLLQKKINVDCLLTLNLATEELFQRIKKFEPFGYGNSRPAFAASDAHISTVRYMGKENQHIKFLLEDKGAVVESLLFYASNEAKLLKVGEKLNLVYSIDINSWKGTNTLQLMIKDFSKNTENDERKASRRKRVPKTS